VTDLSALLIQAADPWAAFYNHSKALITLVTFGHLAGVLTSGGVAIVFDLAILRLRLEDPAEPRRHLGELSGVHRVVLFGFALTLITGVLMLSADLEALLVSRVFWTKMGLLVLLALNGLVMLRAEGALSRPTGGSWSRLRATAVVSLVLWFAVVLASTAMATLG
jgi:hypothetical protein